MKQFQDYQNELDAINKQIAELKLKKADLNAEIEEHGYYVVDNKVKKTERVWGAIVKWLYYSRYVGDGKGALHDYSEFSTTLNDTEYNALINAYKSKNLEELCDLLSRGDLLGERYDIKIKKTRWDYSGRGPSTQIPIPEAQIKAKEEKLWSMFSLVDTGIGEELSFRYAGSDDQGEYVDGSGFTLGPFSKKYIDKYKSISFDDEFDADSGVEWDKREF